MLPFLYHPQYISVSVEDGIFQFHSSRPSFNFRAQRYKMWRLGPWLVRIPVQSPRSLWHVHLEAGSLSFDAALIYRDTGD